MSADPISTTAIGTAILDPQSWNAYAYVRNNPTNLVDPTGAVWCSLELHDCITDSQKQDFKDKKNDIWLLYTKQVIDDKKACLTVRSADCTHAGTSCVTTAVDR